ncbi:hypothetical protein [Oceanospirillum beijerinckii]|uniref:hypothetical protein n=1 Tax=Oceanospirillum beijerinckii TaxID=64976 RepID=UPI00040FE03C|nr:hypothetical protein [Oceanospirillum beijerinckii]
MKYHSLLPLSALAALSVLTLLIHMDVIPSGEILLSQLQGMLLGQESLANDLSETSSAGRSLSDISVSSALLLLLIILLESIVYLGFYFPGQFFAVVLVVLADPSWLDMLVLTVVMVAAATLGSLINYGLGYYCVGGKPVGREPETGMKDDFSLRNLLLAMLHTNALAFYMFNQGAERHPVRVVFLAGLINLPYYLLLIAGTTLLSRQVMYVAETPQVLLMFLLLWLVVALWLDKRKISHHGSV